MYESHGGKMPTLEMARLELSGAAQSLRIAQQDLESFLQEHAGEKELQRSLAHEEQLLRTDIDSALKRHQESLRRFEEARDTRHFEVLLNQQKPGLKCLKLSGDLR